jgi:hypothetical protein
MKTEDRAVAAIKGARRRSCPIAKRGVVFLG